MHFSQSVSSEPNLIVDRKCCLSWENWFDDGREIL